MNHELFIAKQDLRRTPVRISISGTDTEITATAVVTDGIAKDISAESKVVIPDDFEGKPLEKDRILDQLGKTLDTPFTVTDVIFENTDKFYCPVSIINYLRRDLLTVLEVNVVNSFKKNYGLDSGK